jgi:hypothetical protein
MYILQPWVPAFNVDKPQELYVPTWITLRKLPREYLGIAIQIAEQMDKFIGSDASNPSCKEPRFYIRLKPGEGWEPEIVIKRKFGIKVPVLIDYDNLRIPYRFRWSTRHQIRNCKQLYEM